MELLPDPLSDRQIKEVQPPPQKPLLSELLFLNNSKIPNLQVLYDHLLREGKLIKSDLFNIITSFIEIVSKEPNVLILDDPITIVGDIHGQFYDIGKIIELGGNPSSTKYLFLGDYVDRGMFSIEVITYLYSLKISYPKNVFLLRGNHECRQLTTYFNFKNECNIKYGNDVYDKIMLSFDALPLAAIVNNKFPCVHGGISPKIKRIEDVSLIKRFKEPPKEGAFCDLLWADPIENENEAKYIEYTNNPVRGCSYFFGAKATKEFLGKNDYISILRAHEAQLEGFKMYNWDENADFPSVITIFSAPNYCDVYNNKAAIIKIKENQVNLQQFNYSPHPFVLPDFQNVFYWSLPFISEKSKSNKYIYIY